MPFISSNFNCLWIRIEAFASNIRVDSNSTESIYFGNCLNSYAYYIQWSYAGKRRIHRHEICRCIIKLLYLSWKSVVYFVCSTMRCPQVSNVTVSGWWNVNYIRTFYHSYLSVRRPRLSSQTPMNNFILVESRHKKICVS